MSFSSQGEKPYSLKVSGGSSPLQIGCQPGSSNSSSFKRLGRGGTSAKPDENIELDLLEWKPRIRQQNWNEKEEKINFLEYPEEEKWDKITTNQEMFSSEKVKFYWTDSCGEK